MEKQFEIGYCRACGQQQILVLAAATQDAADDEATENCDCEEGMKLRQIVKGCRRIDELFGPDSENLGFVPIHEAETLELLHTVVKLTADKRLLNTNLDINRYGKAKIGMNSKGKINVKRSVVNAYQLEE